VRQPRTDVMVADMHGCERSEVSDIGSGELDEDFLSVAFGPLRREQPLARRRGKWCVVFEFDSEFAFALAVVPHLKALMDGRRQHSCPEIERIVELQVGRWRVGVQRDGDRGH
jgi:hypothetical protein